MLGFYEQFEGDMGQIMENVMCATFEEEDRIRAIIQESIDDGDLEEYAAFDENKTKKVSISAVIVCFNRIQKLVII